MPYKENTANKNLKPPLKWAGGKRWLVPHLLPIWNKYKTFRLVEPFCGGLSVALALNPTHALLNDINPHLINFYNSVSEGLNIFSPMKNEKDFFYTNRERFNMLIKENKTNTKEAAEFFYYLNRTAFNGLCRFNSSGEFNVPFGKYKTINYKNDFMNYKDNFKNWTFTCADFENLKIKKNDFIYADPPYDVEFTRYAKEDFKWSDQERLIKWLSLQACPVIISNQATSRIISLYENYNFKLIFLNAPRMISCTGDRSPVKEVLAMKNFNS